MSILIKDMKMPKSCYDCFIKFGLCSYHDLYSFDEKNNVTRPQKCPLIELPPYGDLIDREDIKDALCDIYALTYEGLIILNKFPPIIEADTCNKTDDDAVNASNGHICGNSVKTFEVDK